MKKLKGILSIVLAFAVVFSTFCFSVSSNAATTETTEVAADANLQDDVQDGVILHAFCWSYSEIENNLEAIASAGYSTIQTSPVQQPKDMSSSTDISGQWWKLYQPVSFSIADNSWLGTKSDLQSLCAAAHKYGIKIICDVVTNHLGASDDNSYYQFADEVATYEPTIYGSNGATRDNSYVHQLFKTAADSSIEYVVQGLVSACPDLNTGDSYIQSRVISLLEECVDCGVDGFRFDAAKHIETSSDGDDYASDYWNNVLGTTTQYAQSTQNKELYYYGEILNTVGSGRSVSAYTSMMSITDNATSNSVLSNVQSGNASAAASSNYQISDNASKTVLWAESHDTYEGTSDSTMDVSDTDIVKAWAIVASRKDATALYFARPGTMSMGGVATDTTYKSVAVAEINKFHNNFVGQSETLGSSGSIAYVARGTSGIVLVNTSGTSTSASVSGTGLADGTYTDMITGATFTVSGGTVSGQIGSTGVAVVTQGTTTPTVSASQESQTFEGESLNVTLTLSNATSGTYQLENYTPVTFTGSPTISIGSDYNYGDTITLTLTATDGTQTTTTTYKYVKKQAASSGVYVFLPASFISSNSWKTPVYCYVYDEDTDVASGITYKNAAWPGEEMQYDSSTDCYYVQVNNNSCIAADESGNTTTSTFNLATSSNTRVIVSDSSTTTSGGVAGGNQYPYASAKSTLDLNGTSHKLTALSMSSWTTTTDVPGGGSTGDATVVTKGSETVPTSESTSSSSTSESTTTSTLIYGDATLDGEVNIKDVTAIQKHLADLEILSGNALAVSDVDASGSVNIKDATYIQKYIAGLSGTANVGNKYEPSTDPTTESTETTATTSSTATTATTTSSSGNTYTAYFKTTLSWMTSMGCSVYLYDTSSGISYLMEQDTSAYPNVFTAEVPDTCSSVIFYRALAAVDDPEDSTSAYNLMTATISSTNNCYTLESYPDGGDPTGSVGPYVEESEPEFSLTTVYFDNSSTNWSAVYVYGWGYGMNNETLAMTQISGTNIWKLELPQAIPDGVETFLFKDTETTWVNQTDNITVTSPYNCYVGGSGTWTTYTE